MISADMVITDTLDKEGWLLSFRSLLPLHPFHTLLDQHPGHVADRACLAFRQS